METDQVEGLYRIFNGFVLYSGLGLLAVKCVFVVQVDIFSILNWLFWYITSCRDFVFEVASRNLFVFYIFFSFLTYFVSVVAVVVEILFMSVATVYMT